MTCAPAACKDVSQFFPLLKPETNNTKRSQRTHRKISRFLYSSGGWCRSYRSLGSSKLISISPES
jgi:hypothetical protein